MNIFESLIQSYEFNRGRTLSTLDRIEKLSDQKAALSWRPAAGRAHIAWQIMHIGVTEEIFATERLAPEKNGAFTDLWPRFRGGSTPDEDIPSVDEIKNVLSESRTHLLDTIASLSESDLDTIPETLKERGMSILTVLNIISWHESHHQGQAHITLNLFENQ